MRDRCSMPPMLSGGVCAGYTQAVRPLHRMGCRGTTGVLTPSRRPGRAQGARPLLGAFSGFGGMAFVCSGWRGPGASWAGMA